MGSAAPCFCDLDYIPKVCIPRAIPPRYRGAFDQRLQTRGGERWPGHDLASEMRCGARRSKPRLFWRADPHAGGRDGR